MALPVSGETKSKKMGGIRDGMAVIFISCRTVGRTMMLQYNKSKIQYRITSVADTILAGTIFL
jgi:hypothetical protein